MGNHRRHRVGGFRRRPRPHPDRRGIRRNTRHRLQHTRHLRSPDPRRLRGNDHRPTTGRSVCRASCEPAPRRSGALGVRGRRGRCALPGRSEARAVVRRPRQGARETPPTRRQRPAPLRRIQRDQASADVRANTRPFPLRQGRPQGHRHPTPRLRPQTPNRARRPRSDRPNPIRQDPHRRGRRPTLEGPGHHQLGQDRSPRTNPRSAQSARRSPCLRPERNDQLHIRRMVTAPRRPRSRRRTTSSQATAPPYSWTNRATAPSGLATAKRSSAD